MTDPLGDMLTRIRNGQQARKDSILTPASKLRSNVLDVLQREGYIRGYAEEELAGQRGLRIELKYFEGQPPVLDLYGENDIPVTVSSAWRRAGLLRLAATGSAASRPRCSPTSY